MSVVLLVDRQRERAALCLKSVLDQSIIDHIEVLLIDLGLPDARALPGSDHAAVRLLHFPMTMSVGEMLASSVAEAGASLVAFLEEHCVAFPSWAEALVIAHQGPAAGIGGERHNASPGRSLPDLIHLLDDGPWSAPAAPEMTTWLPGGNVAYKRDILMRYGDRLRLYFESEGLLQQKLIEDGELLQVVPEAKYEHHYEEAAGQVFSRWFWQGHATGAARVELLGSLHRLRRHIRRWMREMAYAPHVTARVVRAVISGRSRAAWSRAHLAFLCPLTILAGDVAGTFLGPRRSRERVRDCLLNGTRSASTPGGP